MTLSIQLDPALEQRVETAAVEAGVTTAEFVRQCLEERLAKDKLLPDYPAGDARRAWELGRHVFGKFDSGRSDLSEQHEEHLAEFFRAKHRRS